ncbi:MAG TPA: hemerythrin domain-containing protein [Cytophagales bacterium]|nr:hemerythrin domain-containing protein [Cytophagales bacterium]
MFTRKINELVSEDSVFAWVLHYFGVSFYKYSDLTLEEVCKSRGINKNLFLSQIEAYSSQGEQYEEISQKIDEYPIELIIEYLKYSHHKFVKQRLPYLGQLVHALDEENFSKNPETRDLKFIFPTFLREFIEHIYEEEDDLFAYVIWINQVLKGKVSARPFEISKKISKHALQQHALEHHTHESGMEGVAKITNNYNAGGSGDLLVEVIYAELKIFEQELIKHARIENAVFFPKALTLETKLAQQLHINLNLN